MVKQNLLTYLVSSTCGFNCKTGKMSRYNSGELYVTTMGHLVVWSVFIVICKMFSFSMWVTLKCLIMTIISTGWAIKNIPSNKFAYFKTNDEYHERFLSYCCCITFERKNSMRTVDTSMSFDWLYLLKSESMKTILEPNKVRYSSIPTWIIPSPSGQRIPRGHCLHSVESVCLFCTRAHKSIFKTLALSLAS